MGILVGGDEKARGDSPGPPVCFSCGDWAPHTLDPYRYFSMSICFAAL